MYGVKLLKLFLFKSGVSSSDYVMWNVRVINKNNMVGGFVA
jgi:hypothetical protein